MVKVRKVQVVSFILKTVPISFFRTKEYIPTFLFVYFILMKIIFSWYFERDVKLILWLVCHIEGLDKAWQPCFSLFKKIWIARHFSEHIFENFNLYFSIVKNPASLKLHFPKKMYWKKPYPWGILPLTNGRRSEHLLPFIPKRQNIVKRRLVLKTALKM